jgi:2-polyprenyl-3-methyl-5-hydroxy-6-metoxy-1,4-benzoquinol methylase
MKQQSDMKTDPLKEIGDHLRAEHLQYINASRTTWNKYYDQNPEDKTPYFEIIKFAMKHFDFTGKMIIDFGCGNAKPKDMIRRYKAYAGIDISNRITEKLMNERKNDSTYFLSASMTQFNTPQQTDFGLCLDTLEHIPEYMVYKAILKMSQSIREGVITINLKEIPHEWSSAGEWIEALSDYFEIIDRKIEDQRMFLYCKTK